MSKNKNKNKNTQDCTSSKTENETANEDKELVKYLYDKEIERSKLIVEKTTAAFFLFAVDSGFLALNWKELYTHDNASLFWLIFAFICVIVSSVLLIESFGFTTKINTSKQQNNDISEYYEYLHYMNDQKEDLLAISYAFLAISVSIPVILQFHAQLSCI